MVAQIIAGAIFIIMFLAIITEKVERHIATLISAVLTLVFVMGVAMRSVSAIIDTLNVKSIFTVHFWYQAGESGGTSMGINWETIIFIVGMMIMVEGMATVGFFRWLCMKIAKLVHFRTVPIFMTFMVMSAMLAMFIDSITVILFLAAVTMELAQLLKFNPVPMILSEIFCANLGGSATMCGDPPNIIIGTSLGFSFFDFITNTGVIAALSLIVIVIYFYIVFKKELVKSTGDVNELSKGLNPKDAILDKRGFVISWIIFIIAIILLVTHAQTGLTVAFIGTFIAIVTLITAGKNVIKIIKSIDYKTVLFFVGLFVVVGGLEQTGVLETLAELIGKISGGNNYLMLAIIIWVSGVASAFVDNIPFAATMIPIIKSLSVAQDVNLPILAWALSMGTDIGGSATPIGASANVVGISLAAREGHPIGWKEYCVKLVPATVLVLIVSTIYIFVRYL